MNDRHLLFIIGPPRGGTTLLMRMLNAHSQMKGGPEPHLMTPLAHLGFYARVDKAPYDPFQTELGQRAMVDALPKGEHTYIEAIRAMTDHIYAGLKGESQIIVDKTPAYSLILPFLKRVYPNATYVVLTRHPFAVWCSYAKSFFDDDWDVALAHNPILSRYIPAISNFLTNEPPEHLIHIRYDQLVMYPEETLAKVCACAGVPFEPEMVNYGSETVASGLGDPVNVDQNDRPVATHMHAWTSDVDTSPERRAFLEGLLDEVSDQDLEAWGFPRASLWEPMANGPAPAPKRRWTWHRAERKAIVKLRKNMKNKRVRAALQGVKFRLDANEWFSARSELLGGRLRQLH